MHVLQINSRLSRGGGPQTYMHQVTTLLCTHGHRVSHFGMLDEFNPRDPDAPYFVSPLDMLKVARSSSLLQQFRAALRAVWSREASQKLRSLIRAHSFDIAHVHYIRYELSPSILPALRAHGLPVVQTVHDYGGICPRGCFYSEANGICERCHVRRYYRAPLARCIKGSLRRSLFAATELTISKVFAASERNIDLFIFPSKFMLDKYVEYGLPRDRAALLPNSVNVVDYVGREDAGYCVYVGGLRKLKGVHTLLRAAEQLPSIPLLIIGDGEEFSSLQATIAQCGLTHVQLCGHLSGAELRDTMAQARFTIVPSEWYENCPMVALEAFALSKPVIGARIGGIPELVEHKITGLLFEPCNVQDLVENMAYLYDRPSLAKRLGAEARQRMEHRYSFEKHYGGLCEAYEKAKRSNVAG